MKEIRIDCAHQSEAELALAKEQAQLVFRLNHTMLMTDEYDELLHRLFPNMGEGSRVNTPLTVVRPHEVKIGRHVVIMNGCLMMSAGGITIDDDVQIAANVQLISNNHDLDNRSIITCHNRVRFYIAGHNTTRSYNTILTDCNSRKDRSPCSYPCPTANMHWLTSNNRAIVEIMII